MEKIVVSCLESRIDENQSVYSRFLLGPFLSGHAVTVATALRRALLSEVKNIAITALHIQGVTHEFSTVVGIRESVLELSLNFQQIILSTQTKPKSVQIGYLHVQGPTIVHANDLKLPDGIECVNPTQYIATLSTEGLLVVKFLIGGKKSFLKSNTSTLNSKKIKEAKAYSAELSKSLLSHAEYDPPRVFRLLRNQSLPNGAIARRAIEEANLLGAGRRRGSSEQSKGPLGSDQIAFGNLRTGRLARACSASLSKSTREQTEGLLPFDKSKVTSVAFGASPSEPNLVLKEQNLVEPSSPKVGFFTGSGKPTQKASLVLRTSARTGSMAGSVGQTDLVPDLEVPRPTDQTRDSLSRSESATIIDANSNLDQSACSAKLSSRISDEFNSEVCLRTIIPLDPIFTPVYQVNFGIERDDLSNQIRERVIMEIWTNGSIHPRQAINEAALSTISIFSKLRKTFQLDSHSLGLSVNSTIPAVDFAKRNVVPGRGSRLHKSKSIVKSGLLNDDVTENLGPLARSALRSLVLSPSGQLNRPPARTNRRFVIAHSSEGRVRPSGLAAPGGLKHLGQLERSSCWPCSASLSKRSNQSVVLAPPGLEHLDQKGWGLALLSFAEQGVAHWGPVTRKRFARVAQERRVNYRRFALTKPSVTKLDLTNLVGQKLKSFSSFGFVRSRHPVSLFLQNFGKSYIRGQTFLLEQSFGLKARFFKGHYPVLSKAQYTSDDHTFKRTFLPSFKVVLGPLGANRSYVPPTTKAILLAAPGQTELRALVRRTSEASLTRPKPEQNRAGLTKAALLFELRFCLAGAVFPRAVLGVLSEAEQAEQSSLFGCYACSAKLSSCWPCSCSASLSKKLSKASKSFANRYAPSGHSYVPGRVAQGLPLSCSCFKPRRPTGDRFAPGRLGQTLLRKVASPSKNHALGRLSSPTSCPPARTNRRFVIARLSETGQVACSASLSKQPKPILFLIKYRTFSFTRNALRLFGCKQEDSSFLLPLAKQLIRVKMARVFTSCLPLMSKRSEPSLRFRFTETQAITTVEGSGRFDVKQILLSLAQSALGLQNNSCGSENFAERECSGPLRGPEQALAQNQKLRALVRKTSEANGGAIETIWLLRNQIVASRTRAKLLLAEGQQLPNGFVKASSAAGTVSPTYSRQLAEPMKEAGTMFRLAPKGPKSILSNRPEQTGRQRPVGWQKGGLVLRAPQKRIASSIALRGITPFGRNYVSVTSSATSKLWLRSNLKKQFGFFQFASNGLRAGPRRAFVQASRPGPFGASVGLAPPGQLLALLSFAEQGQQDLRSASHPKEGRTLPGTTFRFAKLLLAEGQQLPELRSGSLGPARPPHGRRGLERLGVCVKRIEPLTNRSHTGGVRTEKRSWTAPFDFTTFSLMMTKVPPLCLPSGLVTLISSPSQEYRRPARSVRVAKAILADQVRRRRLEAGTTFRLAQKGVKSEPATSEVRRCFSAADLFGFNSDASVRSEFPFQLTTQAGSEFRLAPQGPKRLSILYSSNLDKMSFLSSDLANLSLSLKTYTFLKKKGKKNIASLLEYSPNTLFSLLNGDEKMFHEIERCLLFLGLPFKEQS